VTTVSIAFLERLATAPAYCFTTDLDWAPESMVEETLSLFDRYRVPLTPFITHASPAIARRYEGTAVGEVGVHPNFRPGSSHGATESAVVDHVLALWPAAKCFRSHGFVDSSSIAEAFHSRGLQYDSNLCLYLQPGAMPLQHVSGLVRFPVFLEDDDVAAKRNGWSTDRFEVALRTPGLKIFNFHPQHVCLNTPDLSHYERAKGRVGENRWHESVHEGAGARTLLVGLLEFVRANPGLGVFSLRELYDASVGGAMAP